MHEEIGKLLALWILYLSYMVFGALVFRELEFENEQIHVRRFKDVLQDIHLKNNVSEAVIVDLSKTFRDAFSMGIDPSTMHQPKWDMAGSFYFVGTVITTIGFGLTAPATKLGQICFLPYALIGIPLNILLFNNLLDLTVQFITFVLHHFHRWWRRSRRKPANQNCHDNPWEPSTLSIAFCCVFAVAVVIFITVPLFVVLEEWTFFESVYFAVVAFTTVGFGDYVPSGAASATGHNLSPHYKIGSWIVIIVGLVFMYPALAVIASVYKELLNYAARKCQKWNNTRKSNRILASPPADSSTSPSIERKRRLEEEESTKRTAQLVLKNW